VLLADLIGCCLQLQTNSELLSMSRKVFQKPTEWFRYISLICTPRDGNCHLLENADRFAGVLSNWDSSVIA